MDETAKIRHLFVRDRLPQVGKRVELLCNHDGRPQIFSFLGAWGDDGWIVADTKRRVESEVIGWREVASGRWRRAP